VEPIKQRPELREILEPRDVGFLDRRFLLMTLVLAHTTIMRDTTHERKRDSVSITIAVKAVQSACRTGLGRESFSGFWGVRVLICGYA
jgi:hypothetical protein